jgi:hypothetical protein
VRAVSSGSAISGVVEGQPTGLCNAQQRRDRPTLVGLVGSTPMARWVLGEAEPDG